jgi:ABC-2 type transport system permease protein
MKKYFEVGKINFLNNIIYFGEFFFKALFILLILFIFIHLWMVIYKDKPIIDGFTMAMVVWYLLFTESIVTSTSSVIKDVNKEIQSGDIAYQLNKPFNYVGYHLAKSLSYRVICFSTVFILGSILVYYMVGGFAFNLATIPLILIILILALLLDFFMIMSIALLAFWFEDTNSFYWIYSKILFTIGGMLLPLEFFPSWLSKLSQALPFSYVAYHPAKLFVSFDWSSFGGVIGVQFCYIVLFVIVSLIIYKIGVRGLNVNGG